MPTCGSRKSGHQALAIQAYKGKNMKERKKKNEKMT